MLKLLERFNNTTAYQDLISNIRSKNFTTAFGVQKYEKPFLISTLDNFAVYVVADYVEAQQVLRTLNSLKGGFEYLPFKDDVLLFKNNVNKTSIAKRNQVLNSIVNKSCNGLVVCIDALMQLYPSVELFNNVLQLDKDSVISFDQLNSKLTHCGYVRMDAVEDVGDYAIHGDIVDIVTNDGRYRIDFFDDVVESITLIGQDKHTEKVHSLRVYPLVENTGADSAVLEKLRQLVQNRKVSADAKARLNEIVDSLVVSAGGDKCYNSWLTPFLPFSSLAEYLPSDAIVVWDEPKLIQQRVEFLYNEHNVRVASLIGAGEILPLHAECLVDSFRLFDGYKSFKQLAVQTLPYSGTFFNAQAVNKFVTSAVTMYGANLQQLKVDVNNWLKDDYEVCFLTGDKSDIDNVVKLLRQEDVIVEQGESLAKGSQHALALPINVEHGFVSHTNKLVVVGMRELGRTSGQVMTSRSKRNAFLSVEKGDYVVHDFHGIGLCEGIEKITSPNGESKDYIVVSYKKGDRLYVPAENSEMLSRYSGGEHPTLSKLGGDDFAKVKDKVKSSVKAMSIDLIKLYAERQRPRGFKYQLDSYLQEQFASSFDYVLTQDQVKSIEEIRNDLQSNNIMDRVLVGDVGFGKTEVAMRATFDVVCNQKQVAVLVPTTILAEQHYLSFVKRMKPFNINVQCVNRFRTPQQQADILSKTALGEVDVLIGTHRLLSKDVHFKNLGLLVLDEEQRFGVEHKEHIKNIKSSVDVLTLSATPIPRTLHMALSGIRDISTITTPPIKRMPVETFVLEENDALIRDIVMREVGRGGQVFFVYNRVESIDSFATKLSALLPDIKMIVAHGQMQENLLEDSIYKFQQGKADLLLCTTIIENGINMPNANTLIVYDADRLGLSQLYQLRGRVGRSDKLAYAYFMYRQDKVITTDAYKRLSSIMQYTQLGSGFKIAMKDLEIRGAGNILGREQHGHMMKVGYDMYARILKNAIQEARGEQVDYQETAQMEVDIDAYAPDDYIVSQSERMSFYQELASVKSLDELNNLHEQTSNVYGVIPNELQNLFAVAELKVLATTAGVSKVIVNNGKGQVEFASRQMMFRQCVIDSVIGMSNRCKFANSGFAVIFDNVDYYQKERLMSAIKEFLQSIVKSVKM